MKDKHFEKWGTTRAKGRKRFLLYSGVLHWGGFMFVFSTFIMPVLMKARIPLLEKADSYWVEFLAIIIPAAILLSWVEKPCFI